MARTLIVCLCMLAPPVFGQGHIMEAHESNPPADLLMSQTFNEGQGAKDWSEKEEVATLVSTPLFSGTNGVSGNDGAYYFVNPTAAGDDAIVIANLVRPAHFTICAWIYAFNVSADYRCLISAQGAVLGWQFRLDQNTGFLRIVIFNPATIQLAGSVALHGAWHHIASTFDGNALRLYVDGLNPETSTPGGSMNAGTGCAIAQRANDSANDRFDVTGRKNRREAVKEGFEIHTPVPGRGKILNGHFTFTAVQRVCFEFTEVNRIYFWHSFVTWRPVRGKGCDR